MAQDWKIILLFDLKGKNIFGENEIKFKEINKRYRSNFNYNYSTLFLKSYQVLWRRTLKFCRRNPIRFKIICQNFIKTQKNFQVKI